VKGLVLSQTDLLVFPLISVVLFTLIFCLTLVWIFRRGASAVYAERSALVFDDDDAEVRAAANNPPRDQARDPEVRHV
jgi:cbb3-type cytochrome oxidase subunit 3